jgi:hypothetical protein
VPAALQAGHIASIAATLWFALGGGAVAVLDPPDDRLPGALAVIGIEAAVMLVAGLVIVMVLHGRAVLIIRATGPEYWTTEHWTTEHWATLQRINQTAVIPPLTAVLLGPHLAFYPPPAPWVVLLALVLSAAALLAHAHAAWIAGLIRPGGPARRPPTAIGVDALRGTGAVAVVSITTSAALLLVTVATESTRDTAAPWTSAVQLVAAALLVALVVRGWIAARRFQRALAGDQIDEHTLVGLSRTLVGSGRLGAAVMVVTLGAVLVDPASLLAVLRTAWLLQVLAGAAVQLALVIGVRLGVGPHTR